jgi:hypothetical protein
MSVTDACASGTLTRRGKWPDLFPRDDPTPVQWRWGLGILAAAVGVAITLLGVNRPLDTVWAEDGTYFYTDVLNRPTLATLVRPLAGYYVELGRTLALPARYVPVEWGPAVMTVGAGIVTALFALAVYAASRTHLRTVPGRLVAAAPVLAVPVGENLAATTADNVATLQFIGIYAVLWMLFWRPVRWILQVVAYGVVLIVTLSTFLVVALLPLAVLRVILVRDRLGQGMLATIVAGAALNLLALHMRLTARPDFLVPHYDPVWALRLLIAWAVPASVFGYRVTENRVPWTATPGLYAIGAIVLLTAGAGIAARFCNPQWTVAGIIAVEAVILFCGSTMSAGRAELRYVVAPELMLFAALAALLRPSATGMGRRRYIPIIGLAVTVLLVCAASYRMPSGRSNEPVGWTTLVSAARGVCRNHAFGAVYVFPALHGEVVGIRAGTPPADPPPVAWPVRIPCNRLR